MAGGKKAHGVSRFRDELVLAIISKYAITAGGSPQSPDDFIIRHGSTVSLHRRTAIVDGTPHKEDDCTEVLESHECQESVQAGLKEVKIRGRELFSKLACFSDIHS